MDIPEEAIAGNIGLSREVNLFFRDQGERQDGDCGPAAVNGALYYLNFRRDTNTTELDGLLNYQEIHQFVRFHLQHK
jgi:hypothetical protein